MRRTLWAVVSLAAKELLNFRLERWLQHQPSALTGYLIKGVDDRAGDAR